MTKERVVHPPIKMAFDKIGQVALTDTLGAAMERFQDTSGKMYDHSTHMGTEYMHEIAIACFAAHRPGMSNTELWQEAKRVIASDVSYLSESVEEHARLNPRTKADYAQTEKRRKSELRKLIRTTLLMYAIERQDNMVDKFDDDDVDQILMSSSWPIADELELTRREFDQSGLVVYDPSGTIATPVSEFITNRPKELEERQYRLVYNHIKHGDPLSAAFDVDGTKQTLRYAEHLSNDQYDTLLEKTLDCIESAENSILPLRMILDQLPAPYLRTLYDRTDPLASRLREALLKPGEPFAVQNLRGLHHYFPGGITGEVARAHPTLGYGLNDSMQILCKALPSTSNAEMSQRCTPNEIAGYNQEVRGVIRDACVSLLGQEHGELFARDTIRSIEPRKYMEGTQLFDQQAITRHLMRLKTIVGKLGVDATIELHEKFDLASCDVMSHGDIATLKGLVDNDPSVIDKLRKQDVTLIAFDAYGSENEVFRDAQQALITGSKDRTRIVLPWRDPSDLYRLLALLKSRGVKFDTLAIGAHGVPGGFVVNKEEDMLYVASTPLPEGANYTDRSVDQAQKAHLSQTALRRIAKEYMELPKHLDAKRGDKKRLILISCSSDVGIGDAIPSTAQSMLETAQDPDLVVLGVENVTMVPSSKFKTQQGLELVGPARDVKWDEEKQNSYNSSNVVALTLDQGSSWTVTRAPHTDRIFA